MYGTAAINAAIAARYPAPEYATFFEVGEATGGRATRRADAIAMSLWPSRGLSVHGFEIKVSRGDWLRELRDPAKSAPIQRFCNTWSIVVDQPGIVRPGELPATWGLLVLAGKALKQEAPPPALEPEPLTRDFVAAILRAASGRFVDKSVVAEQVEAGLAAAVAREYDQRTHEIERLRRDNEHLRAQWNALEAVVGRDAIYKLQGAHVMETDRARMQHAIAFVAGGGMKRHLETSAAYAHNLRRIANDIDMAVRDETLAAAARATHVCDACGAQATPGPGEAGFRCGETPGFVPCKGTLVPR